MLLILALAMPPAILLGWQSLARLDAMAESVANSGRATMLESSRHYMGEKVADIGAQLRLTTIATVAALKAQQRLMEVALASAAVETGPILHSEEVPGAAEAVEENRFNRDTCGLTTLPD
jgi:hypothetical protein